MCYDKSYIEGNRSCNNVTQPSSAAAAGIVPQAIAAVDNGPQMRAVGQQQAVAQQGSQPNGCVDNSLFFPRGFFGRKMEKNLCQKQQNVLFENFFFSKFQKFEFFSVCFFLFEGKKAKSKFRPITTTAQPNTVVCCCCWAGTGTPQRAGAYECSAGKCPFVLLLFKKIFKKC